MQTQPASPSAAFLNGPACAACLGRQPVTATANGCDAAEAWRALLTEALSKAHVKAHPTSRCKKVEPSGTNAVKHVAQRLRPSRCKRFQATCSVKFLPREQDPPAVQANVLRSGCWAAAPTIDNGEGILARVWVTPSPTDSLSAPPLSVIYPSGHVFHVPVACPLCLTESLFFHEDDSLNIEIGVIKRYSMLYTLTTKSDL